MSLRESLGDTVAGGLGGLACVLAGQPLDTMKVKLQTHPGVYKSLLQAISRTYWEDGIRGFYAGATASVVSNAMENAVLFLSLTHCQRVVQWACGVQRTSDMSVPQRAIAGSLASIFSSIALTPSERVKCSLQVYRQLQETQCGAQQLQRSTWGVTRQIIRKEGVRGLFRGLTSTWAREVPGYFFFFGGYDASRKLLSPRGQNHEDLGSWRLALAGGLAGCCFWTAVFPCDVVKSRIQVKGDLSGSFLITLFHVLRNEGIRALYKGLLPTVIRSFPANGALFLTYEHTRKYLVSDRRNSLPE